MFSTLPRLALAALISSVTVTSAYAFTADDCLLLQDLVVDSGNSFAATRVEPPVDDTDDMWTEYTSSRRFSGAEKCDIIVGKTLFNENMTCYFGNIDIPAASAFIEGCLGDKVTAIPDEFPEQSARYEFTEPAAGSISLWRPIANLVFRIDRKDPSAEAP